MSSTVKYFRERDLPKLTGETKDVCRRLVRTGKIPWRLQHGRRIYPRAQTLTAIEKLAAAGEIRGSAETVRATKGDDDRPLGPVHARAIAMMRDGCRDDEVIEELELSLEDVEKLRRKIERDDGQDRPSVARTRLEQKRAELHERVAKYTRRTA